MARATSEARWRKAAALTVWGLGLLAPAGGLAAPRSPSRPPTIEILSTRSDLVSGPTALTAIAAAASGQASIRVRLNGRDVSAAFARRANGMVEGMLTDLHPGENTVRASLDGRRWATTRVLDHPAGGPLLSGPQVTPWACQPAAIDRQCDQPASYAFFYVPAGTQGAPSAVLPTVGPVNQAGTVGGGQFLPYDPANAPPAAAIATTTTDTGRTVPYIIRVETGYMDRDQYSTAVLYDPGARWLPWAPQPGWNHKLVVTHGAGCGSDRTTGNAPAVLDDAALSRGFAVMSTALDNAGHDCDVVVEAESLIMAKEHVIDEYGTLRFTIGVGCSGGALTMQQVANAYPGIYQGIVPQCSFPDAWSTGQQMFDDQLLRDYLEDPAKWGPGITWDPAEIAAVEGNPNHANSVIFTTALWSALADPTSACAGVPAAQRYDPGSNPNGVRCDLADYMINQFGLAPGHRYAGRPLDNVGVQYGLGALRAGTISGAQFTDLNLNVGGYDLDARHTVARTSASAPALANAYRDGAINETNNLRDVAIIDLRGTDQGEFHDVYRAFAIRARLLAENRTFANQVIWEGVEPTFGDITYPTAAFLAMDRWLSRVEADHRSLVLWRKLIIDRPHDVHDQCSDGAGHVIPSAQVCQLINPVYSTPRVVAGESIATDVMRCRLGAFGASGPATARLSPAQTDQLRRVFSAGVCDYSIPGVDQQPTAAWMTYQTGSRAVIYGGRQLRRAPGASGRGWTSTGFRSWLAPAATGVPRRTRYTSR